MSFTERHCANLNCKNYCVLLRFTSPPSYGGAPLSALPLLQRISLMALKKAKNVACWGQILGQTRKVIISENDMKALGMLRAIPESSWISLFSELPAKISLKLPNNLPVYPGAGGSKYPVTFKAILALSPLAASWGVHGKAYPTNITTPKE